MDLTDALDWLERRHHGVLVTLRRDGRAQTSDIVYAVGTAPTGTVSAERVVRISVCTHPDDPVADELAAVYRAVAGGEHPDWGDFRRAMVTERRLVARLVPATAVGQIHPPT